MSLATPPALAAAISEWFPDLGGRALAVSDMMLKPEVNPTLPLCIVALNTEKTGKDTNKNRPIIIENIVVEFWVKPERYKRNDGSETPFFTFYDYDTLRTRLLSQIKNWLSPHATRLIYGGLIVNVNAYAAIVTMNFTHEFAWCDPDDEFEDACGKPLPKDDGNPFLIYVTHAIPSTPECCEEEPKPEPCPSAMDDHVLGKP